MSCIVYNGLNCKSQYFVGQQQYNGCNNVIDIVRSLIQECNEQNNVMDETSNEHAMGNTFPSDM